jgi:hypothetical protein
MLFESLTALRLTWLFTAHAFDSSLLAIDHFHVVLATFSTTLLDWGCAAENYSRVEFLDLSANHVSLLSASTDFTEISVSETVQNNFRRILVAIVPVCLILNNNGWWSLLEDVVLNGLDSSTLWGIHHWLHLNLNPCWWHHIHAWLRLLALHLILRILTHHWRLLIIENLSLYNLLLFHLWR